MKTVRLRFGFACLRLVAVCAAALSVFPMARAQDSLTKDVAGRDHPILKRYEGSFIAAYSQKEYDEYKVPVGKALNKSSEGSNGRHIEQEQIVEGKITRITYYAPKGRSVLEVFRNYEAEMKKADAEILFSGSGPEELGYDFGALPQFDVLESQLFPYSHTEARYGAYKIGDTFVVIYAAAFENGSPKQPIEKGQTAVQVDIIEAKPMEEKMVTVSATEMEKQISSTGKVALYGILFDFNKAEVKPESEPTLSEIAKLLNESPSLRVLVVGHTDAQGRFEPNKVLSQKRAEAVVAALSAKKIDAQRMFPVGVSFAAPLATNNTEEGRAKNRRVELVEMQAAP